MGRGAIHVRANDSKTRRVGAGSGKICTAPLVVAGSRPHHARWQGIWREYTLIYEECGSIRGQQQAEPAICACQDGAVRCADPKRSGRESPVEAEKYSGSRYYPEIAPISPQFVETTFYSSHTMMEAPKRGGLIASPEARIVDLRHASNRLSEETQSAVRGGPEDRKQLTNEIGARRALRPLGTVAGYDRWWIANFVDRSPNGCRPT
jgi:hypothetical protein